MTGAFWREREVFPAVICFPAVTCFPTRAFIRNSFRMVLEFLFEPLIKGER